MAKAVVMVKTEMLQIRTSKAIRNRQQAGFTLFELLIVMSIAALSISAFFTYYKPGKSSTGLKSIAYIIASRINDVRSAAVYRQSETLVTFDVARKSIKFEKPGKPISLDSKISISVTSAYGENRSDSVAAIRFFPNGSSTGGNIILKQDTQAYELRVNWLTGRVTTNSIPGKAQE